VDGLTILPAHGVAGLGAWVRMWSGLTHGPVFDGTVRARLDAGPAFTHLLALLGGEPVGCAAAFVGDGGGEVQHVVTLPAVRRSGIGTALTVAALRTVAARGAATAVLTSSPAGLRIYQRLGFRRVGWVRRYLWSPSAAEMPA
jgi:ribosomal protein S18 acetylase RimI-like enzyme